MFPLSRNYAPKVSSAYASICHCKLWMYFIKIGLQPIGVARIFDWGGPNPQKFGCLHRNWEWILGQNRKFERFFRPKSGDLQKKKKKKKRSSPKMRVVFRPKPLALLLLYCLITVMCAITEKKLQLNIVRLCCHNFLSLVEFWLGGPGPPRPPLATPMLQPLLLAKSLIKFNFKIQAFRSVLDFTCK